MSPSCPAQGPEYEPPRCCQEVSQPDIVNVMVETHPDPVRLHMPLPSAGCGSPCVHPVARTRLTCAVSTVVAMARSRDQTQSGVVQVTAVHCGCEAQGNSRAEQAPPTQAKPEPQATPQAPQLAGLLLVSTQEPPQLVRPAWQLTAQVPAEQTWPAAHAVPQAPQFPSSAWVSRQVPPQLVRPAWQERPQVPPAQTWPAGQAVPQAPQLASSAWVSRQVPPQLASPAWQVRPQVPPEQTWPASHAVPQAPQLARSVPVSRQEPEQAVWVGWQVRPHVPPEQTWPAVRTPWTFVSLAA